MVVERVARQRRYSVKLWQFEMLARFDGTETFEGVAKEVYRLQPGAFSAMGLLNFYQWLYTEDLVLCECESIFELVGEKEDGEEASSPARADARPWWSDPRVVRGAKIAAAVVFSLSVFRLAYITAPVLEPPANRLQAAVQKIFRKSEAGVSHGELARAAQEPVVEKVSLAAKVEAAPPAATSRESGPENRAASESPSPSSQAEAETTKATRTEEAARDGGEIQSIETLRVQLEECRIRRDEFYLQNDEEGYRSEVHRMTRLAKEIGDIENSL